MSLSGIIIAALLLLHKMAYAELAQVWGLGMKEYPKDLMLHFQLEISSHLSFKVACCVDQI